MRDPLTASLRAGVTIVVLTGIGAGTVACSGKMILAEQAEARRLGAGLHVNFVKANEAASRAVMSNADDAAAAAARDATESAEAAQRDLDALEPLVQSLGYSGDLKLLEQFRQRFVEYRQIDAQVLPLAVENTNLKAQRLASGQAQSAAAVMAEALDRLPNLPGKSLPLDVLRLTAKNGVLEIQVVQSQHIAEANDAVMTQMEATMQASERRVRAALMGLREVTGTSSDVAAASAAFDEFIQVNQEIVRLSRLNTNVRSLAATLGRKRVVAAECESQLRALDDALAAHTFRATK